VDDRQFRQILGAFGLSWHGYRKVRKGVKKRLARHMQELGARSVPRYLSLVESDPRLRVESQRLLTVSISRFFRDQELWRTLERRVFPEICESRKTSAKIWSAGCARGEEPYSVAIAWDLFIKAGEPDCQLELWATDANPLSLSEARAGIYGRSSLKEVEPSVREAYFQAVPGSSEFAVARWIKRGIIWRVHDLATDDPPAEDFSLVLLRNNLLTYYNETIRKSVLEMILESLGSPGFLIVGSHETIPEELRSVERYPFHRLIFRKKKR
jgi:chemotaxis protein methyltransferase CheR